MLSINIGVFEGKACSATASCWAFSLLRDGRVLALVGALVLDLALRR